MKSGKSPWTQAIGLAGRKAMYAKFQAHTDEVLTRLITIVRDDTASHADQIAAGKEILSRAWGSVPQFQVIQKFMEHRVSINADALRSLPQDDLADLEATLMRLVEVPDAEVVPEDAPDD